MDSAPDPDAGGPIATAKISASRNPHGSAWTVVVRGEVDVATSPLLRQQLARLVDDDQPIVVDMSEVTFIDSSGLGVLVEMLHRRRDRGCTPMLLHSMQEPVRRVFEITGLTDLFEVD